MKTPPPLPSSFLYRRMHSLTGLFLVLFLVMHLFTNSQAALEQQSFVHSVNSIHSIPYLQFIELSFLALPILMHGIAGAYYAYQSRQNVFGNNFAKPVLPEYSRNRAYTWQRLTSWILMVGILAHVVHMRFIEYPSSSVQDFGLETLLMLQRTFKDPSMVAFYTLFVLSACYHAFNGLWTFCITWGITISQRSQRLLLIVCYVGMSLTAFLGLVAIWGIFWVDK